MFNVLPAIVFLSFYRAVSDAIYGILTRKTSIDLCDASYYLLALTTFSIAAQGTLASTNLTTKTYEIASPRDTTIEPWDSAIDLATLISGSNFLSPSGHSSLISSDRGLLNTTTASSTQVLPSPSTRKLRSWSSSPVISNRCPAQPCSKAGSTFVSFSNSTLQAQNSTGNISIGIDVCFAQWTSFWLESASVYSTSTVEPLISFVKSSSAVSTIVSTEAAIHATTSTYHGGTDTLTATEYDGAFVYTTQTELETRSPLTFTYNYAPASTVTTTEESYSQGIRTIAPGTTITSGSISTSPECALPSLVPQCQSQWLSYELSNTPYGALAKSSPPLCSQASINSGLCETLRDRYINAWISEAAGNPYEEVAISAAGSVPVTTTNANGSTILTSTFPSTSSLAPGCSLGCARCAVTGGQVRLLYWPMGTISRSNTSIVNATAGTPNIALFSGTTLTSPTVYLSYASMYAKDSCSGVGTTHGETIVPIPDPAALSSLYVIDSGHWNNQIPSTAFFNYTDLNTPIPRSIFERQLQCTSFWGLLNWEGAAYERSSCPSSRGYKPILVVPSTVLQSVDPAWAACSADVRGVYDPPYPLTRASEAAEPTPADVWPSITKASPASSPQITQPRPTSEGGDPADPSHSVHDGHNGVSTQHPVSVSLDPGNELSSDVNPSQNHKPYTASHLVSGGSSNADLGGGFRGGGGSHSNIALGSATQSSSPVFLPSTAQPQGELESKKPLVTGVGAAIFSVFGGRNDPSSNLVLSPGSRLSTVLSADPKLQPTTTIAEETSKLGIGAALVSALDGKGAFQRTSGNGAAGNEATKEISSATDNGGQAIGNVQSVSTTGDSGDNRVNNAVGDEAHDTDNGKSVSFMAYNGPGIAPFTIRGKAYTATSGLLVIVNSQTFSANGPAITISDQVISSGDSGVALGSMTVEYQPPATLAPFLQGAVMTLGSSVITAINAAGTVKIGSHILVVGDSAAVVSGSTVSIAPSGVAVNGRMVTFSDIAIQKSGPAPYSTDNGEDDLLMAFTISGTPYSLYERPGNPGIAIVSNSQDTVPITLSADGPAETIQGHDISLLPSGIVLDGTTRAVSAFHGAIATISSKLEATFVDATGRTHTAYEGSDEANAVIDGSIRISMGGLTTLADGEVVGLATSAILVDGTKYRFSSGSGSTTAILIEEAAFTDSAGNSHTALESIGKDGFGKGTAVLDGSITLREGGPTTAVGGHVVGMGSSGIVVDGSRTADFISITTGSVSMSGTGEPHSTTSQEHDGSNSSDAARNVMPNVRNWRSIVISVLVVWIWNYPPS